MIFGYEKHGKEQEDGISVPDHHSCLTQMQEDLIEERGALELVQALEHNARITHLRLVCTKRIEMKNVLALTEYRAMRFQSPY